MSSHQSSDPIAVNFNECYDIDIMTQICDYVAARVGGLTEEFTAIVGDVLATCLFFSGDKELAERALQFMMNVGGFYHGDIAKTAYEYVLSFNVLQDSVFPPTYEDFRNEAKSFGIEFLD